MELSEAAMSALRKLYFSESGLLFEELGIETRTFIYLASLGLIQEPEGQIVDAPGNLFAVHNGRVFITEKGRAEYERYKQAKSAKSAEWFRWLVTTAIAVAALIVGIVSIALQYR